MKSKKISEGDEVLAGVIKIWKKVEKQLNQQLKDDIGRVLEQYLISNNLTLFTSNDLPRVLDSKFGSEVQEFILTLLINKIEIVKKLKIEDAKLEKYLVHLHDKYSSPLVEAKIIYDYPERWKLLNTDLVRSKNKGFVFRSKIIRYDGQIFYFESLPEDYFTMLTHFIKKLSEIKVEPFEKYLKNLDSLKVFVDNVKKESIKKHKNFEKDKK